MVLSTRKMVVAMVSRVVILVALAVWGTMPLAAGSSNCVDDECYCWLRDRSTCDTDFDVCVLCGYQHSCGCDTLCDGDNFVCVTISN
jgi:hypothetical protein